MAACESKVNESEVASAWDYKGRPVDKSRTGGWAAAAMILGSEATERLTTLGIAVNMVTYLTATMHLGNASSANTVTNFLGTSFMLSLLGGFLADTFLGRYLTIAIFTTIQALGVTILTISTVVPGLRPPKCESGEACIPANGKQMMVLYVALYMTALGTGGLKSSVSGFGSDQFDEDDKEERKMMTDFFNWFFFFISIGSLAAVTVLVYIQDHLGRDWGYGICAASILLGLLVFLGGTRRYRFKKLTGSPLTQIAAVFVAAWRKRRLSLPPADSKHALPHSNQFRLLDKASIKGSVYERESKWSLSSGDHVEEVKSVVRMLPIWATTVMFWTVYAQVVTFSVSQATTMDRHVIGSFQIPAASLTVFFVASILVTVPIYDSLVVPATSAMLGNPHGLTPLQRIGVGLVFSIFAMVAAALTELKRLSSDQQLSVFWLIPQFLLVGSGEAFTYIGQLDFFLRECPKGMKTMSTGLFLSTLSLGFFVSSFLVVVVHKLTGNRHAWLADNLDEGKLYNFYWLLAALSALNLVVYLVFANWYVYKDDRLTDDNDNQDLKQIEVVSH